VDDVGDPDHCELLREGYRLMRLAPDVEADRVAHVPGEARFETLVASGAWASAALALVPERAGYLLSRGEAGTHLASIVLDGPDEEIAAEAFSPALALLAALAGAFSRDTSCREVPLAGAQDEPHPVSLARWVPRGRPN
jgi:hypothetical protein